MLSGFYRFSNVAHDTRCQRGGTDQGGDDGTDGVVELYLSAETQNYEAPIQKASLIAGNGNISVSKNRIKGFSFAKGQAVRVSIELAFYDYCSMEVKMYATQK